MRHNDNQQQIIKLQMEGVCLCEKRGERERVRE